MKTAEFKAWFEGFTEALDGTPNPSQWARIKEMVGKIDGTALTERVFVDRYWPARTPNWIGDWPYKATCKATTASLKSKINASAPAYFGEVSFAPDVAKGESVFDGARSAVDFDATQAMYAAGKLEAEAQK